MLSVLPDARDLDYLSGSVASALDYLSGSVASALYYLSGSVEFISKLVISHQVNNRAPAGALSFRPFSVRASARWISLDFVSHFDG